MRSALGIAAALSLLVVVACGAETPDVSGPVGVGTPAVAKPATITVVSMEPTDEIDPGAYDRPGGSAYVLEVRVEAEEVFDPSGVGFYVDGGTVVDAPGGPGGAWALGDVPVPAGDVRTIPVGLVLDEGRELPVDVAVRDEERGEEWTFRLSA